MINFLNKKTDKFFYGWVIVFSCMILYGASIGIFSNCFSIFIKPVTESLNVSRGSFTFYSVISGFVGIIASFIFGELYRRSPLGIRRFVLYGGVVCCSVFIGYSFADSLIHFYILAAVYGCASCTLTGLTVNSLLDNWFIEKRGLAMGFSYAGSGIIGSIMMPIVSRIIEDYGWRNGFRFMSGVSIVLIMIAILLIKVLPSYIGATPLGLSNKNNQKSTSNKTGLTRKQAIKTPAYWLFVAGMFLIGVVGMGIANHLVTFLTDIGHTSVTAAGIMSLVLIVMIAAKICMGYIFDRIGPIWSSVFVVTCLTLSIITLVSVGTFQYAPLLFAICFGFGWSAITVPGPYLLGENFGTREFVSIFVIYNLCQDSGNSIATSFSGFMYDKFGNYYMVWYIMLAITILSGCLLIASSIISSKKNYAKL